MDDTYLGKKNGKVYYMSRPSDVNYNYEDPACKKEYLELNKHVDDIIDSFKLK